MARVLLAMSGGVDSSVAAWLLREQGHEVVGVFMRHGQECRTGCQPVPENSLPVCGAAVSAASAGGTPAPQQLPTPQQPSPPAPLPKGEGRVLQPPTAAAKGEGGNCCSAEDAADARRVADMLDMPFHVLDFQKDFDRIVDYFVAEYAAGRTPNPCIVCNTWLKFGKLFEYADQFDAEYVATGHHARLVSLENEQEKGDAHNSLLKKGATAGLSSSACEKSPQNTAGQASSGTQIFQNQLFQRADKGTVPFFPALCRARDDSKDQSYALFGIRRDLLGRLMFPVGEHLKEDIRRIAERLGLSVADKRDSQEICFVPDQDHARFIREKRDGLDTSGEIVTTDGTPLGRHDGYERFTIGQRKGLGLAFGEPRYVVRIEADKHRVVIGTHEELARRELTASGANWLVESGGCRVESGEMETETADAPPSFRAQVKIRYRSRPCEATIEPLSADRFRVVFDEPCFGVAPGQAAVCYDGDRVLGGGWID